MFNFSTYQKPDGETRYKFLPRDKNHYFFVVNMDYLLMCGHRMLPAAILQYVENRILSSLADADKKKRNHSEKDLWVVMSYDFIAQQFMQCYSRSTIIREIDDLQQRGLLLSKQNSGSKCSYTLNLDLIRNLYDKIHEVVDMNILREEKIEFKAVADLMDELTLVKMSRVPKSDPSQNEHGTLLKMSTHPTQNEHQEVYIESIREEVGEPSFPQCLFLEDENTPLSVNSTDTTFLLPAESFVTQYSLKEKSSFIKPTTMTETEVILKRYADHPSKFKKEYFRKLSLRALNIKYGDRVEGMLRNFNFEDLETGMRNFLEDQYWREKGTPIDAFMKNPEKYFTPNSGSDEEDEMPPTQTFKEAPRSVQQPQEDPSPQMDPERRRTRRGTRRNDALGLLQVVKSPLYDAAWKELEFIDKISDQEIEAWYAIAVEEWTKVKGFTPQAGSVPLLDLTKNLVTQ